MTQDPVVVVGGGPGGSAAAISLRQHGLAVTLLDQACFPRDKVCGDVLLPAAQHAMHMLGLDVSNLERRAYHCLGCVYVDATGRRIAGAFRDLAGLPRPWWMVRRAVLDTWLVEEARRAGADVRQGWRAQSVLCDGDGGVCGVTVRRPDGGSEAMAAAAVVGADGANSVVARDVGLLVRRPEDVCLAMRAYVSGLENSEPYLTIFSTAQTLPGCAWIAPVGPHEANMGLGLLQADVQRLGVTPQGLFTVMRERCPDLEQRLRGATIHAWQGWWLPGATERRPLVGNGFLLVGDAGAMVDPFTGHGIHHALHAGILAGEVLAAVLRSGQATAEALRPYEMHCVLAFSVRLLWAIVCSGCTRTRPW
jgi:menaquinone-9 beta-reductase